MCPAKSKAQQRLFGIARAVQKGDRPASSVSDPAKMIAKKVKKREVDKFASTPSKNLPDRVKKEMKAAIREIIDEILKEDAKLAGHYPIDKCTACQGKGYTQAFGGGEAKQCPACQGKGYVHSKNPKKESRGVDAEIEREYSAEQIAQKLKKKGSSEASIIGILKKLGFDEEHAKQIFHRVSENKLKEKTELSEKEQQMPNLQKKMHKALGNSINVQCQECGKKFKTNKMVPKCPKCGGYDVDLATESTQPSQLAKLQEKLGRELTTPEKHGLAIAYKTMKMPDAMVGVMGGMTKSQAKAEIERLTGKKYEPRESVNEYEGPHESDAANYWIKCPKCNYRTGIESGEFYSPPPHDKILCPKCKTPMQPEDMQYAKKYGWKESVNETSGEKFQCPKCGKPMTPDPQTGLHKCSCGWKETEPRDEGFKIDRGVPVKEQYKINQDLPWLKKLIQKKTYQIGPVTILLAFDPKRAILGINAVVLVNPSHPMQDAPRHIEAALDGITGLKDTVFKLDQIAPHKEHKDTASLQKLWLLPANKISQWGGQKENVHEYLDESDASDNAKKMGLDYMKFGRWGKKGKVTHKTQNGKLVPVTSEDEKGKVHYIEPKFKTHLSQDTNFSEDSDVWFDNVAEWSIDPMRKGDEIRIADTLKKLVSRGAPTENTIKKVYALLSRVKNPHIKQVTRQAAKILKNGYRGEFKHQYGGGASQASEFLSHLKQALYYNE